MLLSELIFDGEYITASSRDIFAACVAGVTSDSREVRRGWVFVCIKGTHTDGVIYAKDAESRGASLIVCESAIPLCSVPYIKVKNARRTLSFMLSRFWGDPAEKMTLFAVTGTNGKTSTCSYLREIFLRAGRDTAFVGTLKNYLGRERFYLDPVDEEKMSTMTTPDPEQFYKMLGKMRSSGAKYLIMEASSHALRLDKLAPLHFRSAVFTNFSPEHLDFHHDMSDYLLSKCKIFNMSDRVYLNYDDPVCRASIGVFAPPVVGYGVSAADADYQARDIRNHGVDGISYTLRSKDVSFRIRCKTAGEFSVYNTLAAASVACELGIPPALIAEAIENTGSIDGRLERVELPPGYGNISVFIDYAHTQRALENLLVTVTRFKKSGQRVVTLFGCGGERDREKRAPMGSVASEYSDLVILTEDNSRGEDPDQIIADIMRGIDRTKPYRIIKDRKKAIEYVIKNAIAGDIILLVGKGHEEYEIRKEGKVPFSERKIVYACLEEEKPEE